MQDLKHAVRLFMKSPGFTAVVVITMALGIGESVAVFSVIQGTLLRTLPYKEPDRLINILDSSKHEKELAKIFASYADFEEFSRHAHTLELVAADTWAGRSAAVLTGRGPAKAYLTIPVTGGFFDTLGVGAELGRTFRRDDLSGGCAVVLSDKFWRAHLEANPRILGQALSLDDRACLVVGVMPATFAVYPPETQIWTLLLPNDSRLKNHFGVFMIARLKTGASMAQARAELTALHNTLHAHDSNGERDFTPLVDGLKDQFTWLASRTLRSTLALAFAAVTIVLFIACLNVAGLLTGRAFARWTRVCDSCRARTRSGAFGSAIADRIGAAFVGWRCAGNARGLLGHALLWRGATDRTAGRVKYRDQRSDPSLYCCRVDGKRSDLRRCIRVGDIEGRFVRWAACDGRQ